MAEFRFYDFRGYICPRCGGGLLWRQRPDSPDSMMLVHDSPVKCVLSGKKFYAPVINLTEIPVDDVLAAAKPRKRKVTQP
jgi:hypothetical protein